MACNICKLRTVRIRFVAIFGHNSLYIVKHGIKKAKKNEIKTDFEINFLIIYVVTIQNHKHMCVCMHFF